MTNRVCVYVVCYNIIFPITCPETRPLHTRWSHHIFSQQMTFNTNLGALQCHGPSNRVRVRLHWSNNSNEITCNEQPISYKCYAFGIRKCHALLELEQDATLYWKRKKKVSTGFRPNTIITVSEQKNIICTRTIRKHSDSSLGSNVDRRGEHFKIEPSKLFTGNVLFFSSLKPRLFYSISYEFKNRNYCSKTKWSKTGNVIFK